MTELPISLSVKHVTYSDVVGDLMDYRITTEHGIMSLVHVSCEEVIVSGMMNGFLGRLVAKAQEHECPDDDYEMDADDRKAMGKLARRALGMEKS